MTTHKIRTGFIALFTGTLLQAGTASAAAGNLPRTMQDTIPVVELSNTDTSGEILPLPVLKFSPEKYITGAVAGVQGDEIVKTPAPGLASALAGRLPGVIVKQGTQQPYADGVSLYIRGRSTVNGSNPLIVLDGVPSPLLDISVINPQEIASVTVLKDAAETAIYGYQASNGVLLITTKKGRGLSDNLITASVNHGVQQAVSGPTILPSWEYATLRNQAYMNDGLFNALPFTKADIEKFKDPAANREVYPDNNWYGLFMKDQAVLDRYNVSVGSAGQRVNYFLNAGYLRQGSLLRTVKQERYNPEYALQRFTVRANVEMKILENLSAFLYQSVNIDRRNRPTTSMSSILQNILTMPPTENGPLAPEGDVIATLYNNNPPYGAINKSGYLREMITDYHGTLGVNLDLKFITQGLSASGYMAFETKYYGTRSGTKDYPRFIRDGVAQTADGRDSIIYKPYGENTETPLGMGRNSLFGYFLNFNGMLNYQRVFNTDHTVEGFVNYFAQNYVPVYTSGMSIQTVIPYDRLSLSGKVRYMYKARYIAQFVAGYTGSDQFAPGRRAGLFPAVSAAWIASEEHFMKPAAQWIGFLKLRGSFGLTGNDQLPNPRFSYMDNITATSGGPIAGLYIGSLIQENNIANPFATWEKQQQLNLGLDVELLKMFTLRLDAFRQAQKNISVQSNMVPSMQGVPPAAFPYINTGLIVNKGLEADVRFDKVLNKDWKLFLSGNILYNKSKVVDLGELDLSGSGYNYPYRSTGYPIGQPFGYRIDYSNGNGYFNSPQEITDRKPVYSGAQPRPGDFIYQDLNGDGTVDEKDMAPMGFTSIPELSYGVSAGFNYKKLDFYLLLQGAGRTSAYLQGIGVMDNNGRGTYFPIHRTAWTPERYANNEEIGYPALSTQSSSSTRVNDFFVNRLDYMRLKTVEIGYTFTHIFGKSSATNLRLFGSGQNLLTFHKSKFDGLDPEGNAFASYPVYRTYNLGLNIQF
ncbi:TonB-linked outer membrane protein, SusC/RagA family [Niabella drilacis]|uniref:TonB-linked outer membrane protein, SusC/RagA family n=2 Tax=Niabella drilacis (strain DSM 25811 / CCM 8410 / CCUG 62505 / LMG 26954 / E90) TaxID=1285928 RepID=A0A1G6JGC8_NIADE|nr:TonB-linked outer membrane protein, SusC/RagA family [Niabella drilacis]